MQVKGAQEFVDRVQKQLDTHDKLRRELEIELAEGQAKEAKSPPAVQEPPPEWFSEIHRLRLEVARFKGSANQPVRDSVEGRAWMEEFGDAIVRILNSRCG